MTRSTTILLLALSAVPLASAAPAAMRPEPVAVTVTFADLDLASPAGRSSLDNRIRRAAASVCSPVELGLHLRAGYDMCVKGAAADAERRMASLRKGEKRVQVAARTSR